MFSLSTTYTATHVDGTTLEFTHDVGDMVNRKQAAGYLLAMVLRVERVVLDGRRGASSEERLGEYGYTITAVSTSAQRLS